MGRQADLLAMQPIAMQLFIKSILTDRLAHGYLLEGARGTGKKRTAKWLSQTRFCLEKSDGELACGTCNNCLRIENDNHPDVHWLEPDGNSIKIDQVRELKQELSKRGMESDRKVLIINSADKMTVQSANSLLKFIEEPDGGMLILFLTASPQQILPTIQSRLQPVSFRALPFEAFVSDLIAQGILEQKARVLASVAGNAEQAITWNEDEWFAEARNVTVKLYEGLHHQGVDPMLLIQESWMPVFKDKTQLHLGLELLLLLYRDRLHLSLNDDYRPICMEQASMLKQDILRKSLTDTTAEMEIILGAKRKLDSNMNTQLLMEQLVLKIQGR
ncbi:DNA polymerase III subunit delta' [Listeria sp. FSL L7-1582]|uniref:DNA polymerase III subunit delta' n=1 Tax=Listeria portnoyi TaxID=2713504 RepID=UPI00164EBB61|nr:DNA polymerase III subunit delta' [Listeria portnoyi]